MTDKLPDSLKETIAHPDDPLVRSILSKDDHNNLMGRIESLAASYERLAVQLCIPQHKVAEIKFDTRDAWSGLNAVVSEWLRWNLDKTANHCGVTPNRRWLVDAVRPLNKELSIELEQEFKLLVLGKDESKDKALEKNCRKTFQETS